MMVFWLLVALAAFCAVLTLAGLVMLVWSAFQSEKNAVETLGCGGIIVIVVGLIGGGVVAWQAIARADRIDPPAKEARR